MATSDARGPEPLFVYLHRSGSWVTVGAYRRIEGGRGVFNYAPSYLKSAEPVSIDPINLPLPVDSSVPFLATRYKGLHDCLRDASPDQWGRGLIAKMQGSARLDHLDYLRLSSNADRWGALAVGETKSPPKAQLNSPKLALLPVVVDELAALERGLAPVDPKLRARLQVQGSGGARPKATVYDSQENCYWLVKPGFVSETDQIPVIEHFCQTWGKLCGLNFAETRLIEQGLRRPAVLVKRYDRIGHSRRMCLSAASISRTEFDTAFQGDGPAPSYMAIASGLRSLGCDQSDLSELFNRIIFNILCGNDDDHLRNHACCYSEKAFRWELSPAYDVVADSQGTPTHLALSIGANGREISRENLISESRYFGFSSEAQAAVAIDLLVEKARAAFKECAPLLPSGVRRMMKIRLDETSRIVTVSRG